jgi:hypothetical protein
MCLGVLSDVGSQTDSAGSSPIREDTPRGQFIDLLQQLRLGSRWITKQANIDIWSESAAIAHPVLLLGSTKELGQDALLDLLMPEDRGRERMD